MTSTQALPVESLPAPFPMLTKFIQAVFRLPACEVTYPIKDPIISSHAGQINAVLEIPLRHHSATVTLKGPRSGKMLTAQIKFEGKNELGRWQDIHRIAQQIPNWHFDEIRSNDDGTEFELAIENPTMGDLQTLASALGHWGAISFAGLGRDLDRALEAAWKGKLDELAAANRWDEQAARECLAKAANAFLAPWKEVNGNWPSEKALSFLYEGRDQIPFVPHPKRAELLALAEPAGHLNPTIWAAVIKQVPEHPGISDVAKNGRS
ncbi:MAG: hypothetical protein ACOYKZ_04880 [Chlamydiia bacterium]